MPIGANRVHGCETSVKILSNYKLFRIGKVAIYF